MQIGIYNELKLRIRLRRNYGPILRGGRGTGMYTDCDDDEESRSEIVIELVRNCFADRLQQFCHR